MEYNDLNIKRNEKEIEELTQHYKNIADKLLSEFGPEGAFEISDILKEIANEDFINGMKEGLK